MWVMVRGLGPCRAGVTTSAIMEFLTPHDSEVPHPLMSSSPIAVILEHRPTDTTSPKAVTDSERQGSLTALSAVPDPRDPRGIRYPLVSTLASAVCAVIAGARLRRDGRPGP